MQPKGRMRRQNRQRPHRDKLIVCRLKNNARNGDPVQDIPGAGYLSKQFQIARNPRKIPPEAIIRPDAARLLHGIGTRKSVRRGVITGADCGTAKRAERCQVHSKRNAEQQHRMNPRRMFSRKLQGKQRTHGMRCNNDMPVLCGKPLKLLLYLRFPDLHIRPGERFRRGAVTVQQNAGNRILLRDIIEQKPEILRSTQNAVQQKHDGIGAGRIPENVMILPVHR